jgi:hypothetical protein
MAFFLWCHTSPRRIIPGVLSVRSGEAPMQSRNARILSIAALTAGVLVAGLGTSTAQAAEPSTPDAAAVGSTAALPVPVPQVPQGPVDNLLTAVGGLLGGLLNAPPQVPGTPALPVGAAVPGGPAVPATLSVPAVPAALNAPAQLPLPPLPVPLPPVPGVPALPPAPGVPPLPGAAPATPAAPAVPGAPALPGVPPLPVPLPTPPLPLPSLPALPVPLPLGDPATAVAPNAATPQGDPTTEEPSDD